jgi:hypothetical protein
MIQRLPSLWSKLRRKAGNDAIAVTSLLRRKKVATT